MAINKIEGNDNSVVTAAPKVQPASLSLVTEAKSQVQPAQKSELEAAVKRLNELISQSHTAVEFSLDETTGTPVIKVIDTETQSVLRQLPNEEALAFSRNLDRLQGLIVRQKA